MRAIIERNEIEHRKKWKLYYRLCFFQFGALAIMLGVSINFQSIISLLCFLIKTRELIHVNEKRGYL